MSQKTILIDRLDDLVSRYVRLSYANDLGIVECFTCGKKMYWKEAQNGHFHSRRHNAIRFDLKNCYPQCPICNCFEDGNHDVFEKRLINKFGPDIVKYLDLKKNEVKNWKEWELRELIQYFKNLLKDFN